MTSLSFPNFRLDNYRSRWPRAADEGSAIGPLSDNDGADGTTESHQRIEEMPTDDIEARRTTCGALDTG